jgi:hypothetical protein
VTAAESALATVRYQCLLDIRRAAFSPTIGVRYTEAIRSEIAMACFRLESFIDAALADLRSPEPPRATPNDLPQDGSRSAADEPTPR